MVKVLDFCGFSGSLWRKDAKPALETPPSASTNRKVNAEFSVAAYWAKSETGAAAFGHADAC